MPTNVLMNLLEEVAVAGNLVAIQSCTDQWGCGRAKKWVWSLARTQRGRKATRLVEGLSWMEKQFRERLGWIVQPALWP